MLATRASTTLAGAAGMPGSASGIGADARFNAPNGVAVDGQGNLFIADTSNNWIRRVELATGEVTTLATGFLADCLAADEKGNVYYPDWGTIKKLEWATGAITTPPSGPTTNEPPVRPTGIEPSRRANRA